MILLYNFWNLGIWRILILTRVRVYLFEVWRVGCSKLLTQNQKLTAGCTNDDSVQKLDKHAFRGYFEAAPRHNNYYLSLFISPKEGLHLPK